MGGSMGTTHHHHHSARASCLVLALLLSACSGAPDGESNAPPKDEASGPPPAASQPRGHWYRARDDAQTGEQRDRAAALESMGYASGMESAEGLGEGVGVLAEALVQPGLNFYSSGHGPDALLMDLSGNVLHRWHKPIDRIWPEKDVDFAYFRKARLFADGVVLVIFEGLGLAALDADSNVLWTYDRPAHHDVHQAPDGSFYALDRNAHVVPELHPDRPLADDGIVFLEADGTIRGRVSLLDGLISAEAVPGARAWILAQIASGKQLEEDTIEKYVDQLAENPDLLAKIDYIGDCLHTNSVRRIGSEFAAANEGLEEGWYLVSIREINLLAAFEVSDDYRTATARWLLRGGWSKQHEAVPLPDGRIMLFDNLGQTTDGNGRRSRVIDIDPASGEILHSIEGVGGVDFMSLVGGSCQRLPNGNTLVIESTRGSAFEVTPDGELAWSFHNPHRAGEDEELIAFLPDVIRVPEAFVRSWLPESDAGPDADAGQDAGTDR